MLFHSLHLDDGEFCVACICYWQETSLELVVVSEDGVVQSVCEQPMFGTIKDLRVLPWNASRRSPFPQVSAIPNPLIDTNFSPHQCCHLLSIDRIRVQPTSKQGRTSYCRY